MCIQYMDKQVFELYTSEQTRDIDQPTGSVLRYVSEIPT